MSEPIAIEGTQSLTMIERTLDAGWEIPPQVAAILPQQLALIATGAAKLPEGSKNAGNPYSFSARLKAARIIALMRHQNLEAEKLRLALYNAKRPTRVLHEHSGSVQITQEQREAELLSILDAINVEHSEPRAAADLAGDAGQAGAGDQIPEAERPATGPGPLPANGRAAGNGHGQPH